MARQRMESVEEWTSLSRRHKVVTRGELLYWLDRLQAERRAEFTAREESRWMRRTRRLLDRLWRGIYRGGRPTRATQQRMNRADAQLEESAVPTTGQDGAA